jgi:L-fuconolactonase
MLNGLPEDQKTMAETVDAHHHLWSYQPREYGWISDNMRQLARDFLPPDLLIETRSAGIDGTVAVQARQTLEETRWLLSLANDSAVIRGVVGWSPICSETFPAQLESLRQEQKLKGLRHVIQEEPDGNFILRPDFNRGISAMANSSLVYDILIFARHLPVTIQFVDMHPNQVFVLDHIAKPLIGKVILEPWRSQIAELARRKNVYCKLSGMVTEANWLTWRVEDLKPYVDVVLEAFGPNRLMAGSDWPVCLLATTYSGWFATLHELLRSLSEGEKESIFGRVAKEVYRLGEK